MRRLWRWVTGPGRWLVGVIRRVLDTPIGVERADDPLNTLYHRALPPRLEWNWWALIFGPFWYLAKGLWVHAFMLLSIAFMSGGLLIPFVWLYSGLKANEDLLEFRVARRSFY